MNNYYLDVITGNSLERGIKRYVVEADICNTDDSTYSFYQTITSEKNTQCVLVSRFPTSITIIAHIKPSSLSEQTK